MVHVAKVVKNSPYTVYCIAGNFRGRKLSRIGRKGAFRGENFSRNAKTGHIMGVACLEFRGENFRRWLKNCEIRKSFLPQKFSAIRYIDADTLITEIESGTDS